MLNTGRRRQLSIDRTIALDINGTQQKVRICAARAGLPPLLIVQAGPGLPVLHEVTKFQRLLNLERDFLVAYWEQRGCGDAPSGDAGSASMTQQVDDLVAVLRWLHEETKQRVIVFGVSMGGTFALQAAGQAPDRAKAIIAVSPDSQTASSDASAHGFLQAQGLRANGRMSQRVKKLDPPPYLDSAALQQRARLLADLGAIERRKTFNALLREMLIAMISTYGVVGTIRALRNMNRVQRKLLPEIASLDLITDPPRVTVPVHYVFGEQDVLNPLSIVKALPAAIAAPASTVVRVPDAAHMVHFDQPAIVRSIAERA